MLSITTSLINIHSYSMAAHGYTKDKENVEVVISIFASLVTNKLYTPVGYNCFSIRCAVCLRVYGILCDMSFLYIVPFLRK